MDNKAHITIVGYILFILRLYQLKKLSFLPRNKVNPEQKKNDRGIGGTDYTYTDNFSETKTYYFFVPSDNLTYIDETIYKVDAEGNYVNIDKRIENNIVYL